MFTRSWYCIGSHHWWLKAKLVGDMQTKLKCGVCIHMYTYTYSYTYTLYTTLMCYQRESVIFWCTSLELNLVILLLFKMFLGSDPRKCYLQNESFPLNEWMNEWMGLLIRPWRLLNEWLVGEDSGRRGRGHQSLRRCRSQLRKADRREKMEHA